MVRFNNGIDMTNLNVIAWRFMEQFRIIKVVIFTFLLMHVISYTSLIFAESSLNVIGNKTPQLVEGEYLRSDFIEKLRRQRSPLKASEFDSPELITVTKGENGLRLMTIFNYHEGGAVFLLNKDGGIEIETSAGDETSNLKFEIIDSRNFKLGYGKFEYMNYIYVGNAEHYVSGEVLAGKYYDKKGRKFIFQKDGIAVFPKRRFSYKIGLDHIENPYDYFVDNNKNMTYSFKLHDDILEIFETGGEMSEHIAKRPFLTLKKIVSRN